MIRLAFPSLAHLHVAPAALTEFLLTIKQCSYSSSSGSNEDYQARFNALLQDISREHEEAQADAPGSTALSSEQTQDVSEHTRLSSVDREVEATGGSGQQAGPKAGVQEDYRSLIHPQYGYAVLGGVNPDSQDADIYSGGIPRLHPQRMFQPGEVYDPKDLNPFTLAERIARRPPPPKPVPSKQEVLQFADYKNVDYLKQFLSDGGRLLPRKRTRLAAKLHRRVVKQIKIARVMGLMTHEARLNDGVEARLRQLQAARVSKSATA